MIKIKRKKLVLTKVLFIILIFNCNISNQEDGEIGNNQVNKIDNNESGKIIFYNNCSQCHIPRVKDEEFKNFISANKNLTEGEKITNITRILQDLNHQDKNIIQLDTISIIQLESLIHYIESSLKNNIMPSK